MSSILRQRAKRMARSANGAATPQMTVIGSDGRKVTMPIPSLDAAVESARQWNDWHAAMSGLVPDGEGGYRRMTEAEVECLLMQASLITRAMTEEERGVLFDEAADEEANT